MTDDDGDGDDGSGGGPGGGGTGGDDRQSDTPPDGTDWVAVEQNGHGVVGENGATPADATASEHRETSTSFGEAWVYESIVSALPGASLSGPAAITLQVGVFVGAMVVVAAAYDLWNAVVPGTAAILVAAVGSYLMLKLGETNRMLGAPPHYYRLLFGSSIEVVLSVLAFVALITHLFVYEPRFAGEAAPLLALLPVGIDTATVPLVTQILGDRPPIVAVYLTLLVLWDLCYRIGTSWWAAVVSLYRELRVPHSGTAAETFRRLDLLNIGFAVTQAALLPFIADRPVLLLAVSGHIVAVTVVSSSALLLSIRRE